MEVTGAALQGGDPGALALVAWGDGQLLGARWLVETENGFQGGQNSMQRYALVK